MLDLYWKRYSKSVMILLISYLVVDKVFVVWILEFGVYKSNIELNFYCF
jgi:hypothetical protein